MDPVIPPRTLVEYADYIAKAARTISAWCQENGQPEPTLHSGEGVGFLPPSAPLDLLKTRQELFQATKEVQNIIMEPWMFLGDHIIHPYYLSSVHWLCRFDIPTLVPEQGSISYSDLAAAAKVPIATLKSVTRTAMSNNFLRESAPGMVSHNRISTYFAKNKFVYTIIEHQVTFQAPTSFRLADATAKWGATENTSETSFNIAFNSNKPLFKYLADDPDGKREHFHRYMKVMSMFPWGSVQHLVNGHDWKSVGAGVVVDIGGSSGHISAAIAKHFPSLRFIVQDLPEVIQNASAGLDDDDVRSRITFQPYDFFDPQPVRDADVYMLRIVLHDWPDDKAREILRNVRAAMKPSARLLIVETVLPQPGTVNPFEDSYMRWRDLQMRTVCNGRERYLDEWTRLLADADDQWEVKSVVRPFNSWYSIIEVALRG